MSLEKLMALVTPPSNPLDAGTAEAWPEVERVLGTPLPEDYKQLVNCYGTGRFADWIYVFSPFSTSTLLGHPGFLNSLNYSKEQFPEYCHPFPAFPEPGGLLPWGGDDNAGLFCWLTHGPPDTWITINLDDHYSNEYRELPYSVTALLTGWLSGEIAGDWYPDDLVPALRQVFTPGSVPNRF